MNMEEDNRRERVEQKQKEEDGKRKEYGNKEENRRRELNLREWFVEERGKEESRVALKWNRMKDGIRIEWERERMMWKGMNGKNDGNMMKREREWE